MPWKNGQGTTVEILKEPQNATTETIWRLSMADVSVDGEFSNFAGYDRTLILLEGNGVTLHHGKGDRHVLQSHLQAAKFSGDDQTIAELHNGPIKDFNVITQRKRCTAKVISGTSSDKSTLHVKSDLLLLYAVEENVFIHVSGGKSISLSRQHLFVSACPVDDLLECSGGAYILVLVSYL